MAARYPESIAEVAKLCTFGGQIGYMSTESVVIASGTWWWPGLL
jgi:hypothetical protein